MRVHSFGRIVGITVALLAGATAAPALGAEISDRGTSTRPALTDPRPLPSPGLGGTASVSKLETRPTVPLRPCPDDVSWLCGSIRVPVDRAEPDGRSIRIGFNVLPHTDPGSAARDAIFVSDGGPGSATTASRGFRLFHLGPLTDKRDIVLIDHRGTGTSAPINCRRLQSGVTGHDEVLAAVGACGRRLGGDADRYGSGDVALDIEAVRRALGYPRISYYAQSYGPVATQAYAVRFPQRLRAIVADAALPVSDRAHGWAWGFDVAAALASTLSLTCQRAPSCAAAQPDAGKSLAQLARRVRQRPVTGMVRAVGGTVRRVRVGELRLIQIAAYESLNLGELAAVADALRSGDKQPLLRLASEVSGGGDPEDPPVFSYGDNAAAFCNDNDFVWDRRDPIPVRRAKYADALQELGQHAFAPFSARAWETFWLTDFCLRWPAPDRFTRAVHRNATVTGVPTLILSGDLDTQVPTALTRSLKQLFPEARFLHLAGAAHPGVGWSECARRLSQRFIRTLDIGDARCGRPEYVAPAVAEFPGRAAQASPARGLAGDSSTQRDRRVVTVALRSVLDAWLRSFRIPGAVGEGTGLRGGIFDFDYSSDDHAVIDLHDVRLARDVTVRGRTTLAYAKDRLRMNISVRGPNGGILGTLQAAGSFGYGFSPFRRFEVSGTLGGRPVHVSVPAN